MPSSDDVLVRVAAELAYRGSRVLAYLDSIDGSTTQEYAPISQSVRTALESVEEQLPGKLAIFRNEKLEAGERYTDFIDYLSLFSRWFRSIHELLVYLPRQSPVPECPATLRSAFGEQFDTISPSTILGSLFNAVEYDFLDQMRRRLPDLSTILPSTERNIVLELAICDRDSPAAWAVLSHELGHAIDQANSLSETVVNTFITDPNNNFYTVLLSWTGEFCADLIAAEAMGVAPILSILSLEYCAYPSAFVHGFNQTHPPTKWRLQVVADYLSSKFGHDYLEEERELYESAWQASVARAEPTKDAIDAFVNRDANFYEQLVKPIAAELTSKLPSLKISATQPDENSLDRCVARLRACIPVSAQGARREALREKVQEYRKADYDSDQNRLEAFRALKCSFTETPLSIQSILLSAHMRRREQFLEIASQPSRFSSSEGIKDWCNEVALVESVIVKSIQMSTVHRFVSDSLTNTE